MGLGIFLGDVHDAAWGSEALGCEARPAGTCPYGTPLATSRSRAIGICTGQSVTGRLHKRKAVSKSSQVDNPALLSRRLGWGCAHLSRSRRHLPGPPRGRPAGRRGPDQWARWLGESKRAAHRGPTDGGCDGVVALLL